MIGILLVVPRFLKVVYENLATIIDCCVAIALNSVNLMVFESDFIYDLSSNNIKLNLSSVYFYVSFRSLRLGGGKVQKEKER